MLWIELLRKGNVSLLQSKSDTQYCVCYDYDETQKEDEQYYNGRYFCHWGNSEDKVICFSEALENFKIKTEESYISRCRLEELATKFKDGLLECDEDFATEFFEEECELTDSEMEWLGNNRKRG